MTRVATVIFDLRESLVEETLQWQIAGEAVSVPYFMLAAVAGSVIERGLDHSALCDEPGVDWVSAVDHGYAGSPGPFYPDALPVLGLRLGIIASSTSIGVARPDPRCLEQNVDACGAPTTSTTDSTRFTSFPPC